MLKKSALLILSIMAILLISGCTRTQEKVCKEEGEPLLYSEVISHEEPSEDIPGAITIVFDYMPECCPGLEMLNPGEGFNDVYFGICTAKCGNGVCDNETENNYNCGDDCPRPLATCSESGGECMPEGCSGILFELGLPVSDCPGECCVCCKAIIPECVPDQCCHPLGCVLVQWEPDCSDTVCTQECRSGTFDCGCGECEFDFQTEECKIVWSDSEECYA